MEKILDNPAVTGWTPEDIMKLGKEWVDSKVLEINRQESEARMLLRQIQHRFGSTPTWAKDKIDKTDLPTLEKWSLQFVEAKSLEDVFA